MKGCALVLGALAIVSIASVAGATVGGPTVTDVLGWDVSARRVYVLVRAEDGASRFGRIAYFALGESSGDSLHDAPALPDRENTADDLAANRALARLRARLRPMRALPGGRLPWRRTIVAVDTLRGQPWGPVPSPRLRVSFGRSDYELHTVGDRTDVSGLFYAIPGRGERLLVLSFVGDPFEGGYEVQVPILVRPGDQGIRVVTPVRGW